MLREVERFWRVISCLISTKEARLKKASSQLLTQSHSELRNRTLEDKDITPVMEKIFKDLEADGIELRK